MFGLVLDFTGVRVNHYIHPDLDTWGPELLTA